MPSAPRIAALLALASVAAFASACSGGGSGPVPTASTAPGGTSPGASPTPWKATIQEFSLGSNRNPTGIVAGSDGNIWFIEANAGMIGRMSTSGTLVGEYTVPNALQSSLIGITLGSDGNVWFDDNGPDFIAKIDSTGKISETSLPTNTFPQLLTSGPDGNIWFSTASNSIGKIIPTSSVTPTLYSLSVKAQPFGIINGPNNQIWFSEPSGDRIGYINTNGSGLQEFPIPVPSASFVPEGLTTGPDGAVWSAGQAYSASGTPESVIGRVTASGQISYFLTPTQIGASLLCCIVSGPDNFLYTGESGQSSLGSIGNIARITPQTGHIDEATIPSGPNQGFGGFTVGPDGNIWFTETGSSKIGRLLLH